MAQYAQSVAYTRMFKMISSSDHLSLKTGLAPTVNVSKAGGAFAAAAGTVTEIADGWYKIALTTVDTGTLGDLAFYITATGADDTDFVDQVVAPALLASSYTAPPSAASIATAVWTDTADLTTAGSPGKLIHDYLTGDAFARLCAPVNADISHDVAAVKSDSGTLITRIPGTVQPQTGDAYARIGANGAGLTQVVLATPPPTAAAIATSVWTDTADLTTAGSPGKLIHDYLTGDAYARIGANGAGLTAVELNLAQAVPTSNTPETIGDALNAARAQAFGKWTIVGTTLDVYAHDGGDGRAILYARQRDGAQLEDLRMAKPLAQGFLSPQGIVTQGFGLIGIIAGPYHVVMSTARASGDLRAAARPVGEALAITYVPGDRHCEVVP